MFENALTILRGYKKHYLNIISAENFYTKFVVRHRKMVYYWGNFGRGDLIFFVFFLFREFFYRITVPRYSIFCFKYVSVYLLIKTNYCTVYNVQYVFKLKNPSACSIAIKFAKLL